MSMHSHLRVNVPPFFLRNNLPPLTQRNKHSKEDGNVDLFVFMVPYGEEKRIELTYINLIFQKQA